MKLGKYKLSDWERSYGGWFKYDVLYVKKGTFNLFESLEVERSIDKNSELQLPIDSIYDPAKPALWTIYSEPNWFSELFYELYEPK